MGADFAKGMSRNCSQHCGMCCVGCILHTSSPMSSPYWAHPRTCSCTKCTLHGLFSSKEKLLEIHAYLFTSQEVYTATPRCTILPFYLFYVLDCFKSTSDYVLSKAIKYGIQVNTTEQDNIIVHRFYNFPTKEWHFRNGESSIS